MAVQISRSQPGCIAFMVDRSASMGQQVGRSDRTLAQIAADLVNRTITDLAIKASGGPGLVRHYFDVGIFGYGQTSTGEEGVESVLSDFYGGRDIVGIPELADHPVQVFGSQDRLPVWIKPTSGHRRPLCEAFDIVGQSLYEWISIAGPGANPPVIVNVTDGGPATDTPHNGATLVEWQDRVRNLSTTTGSVNIFTVIVDHEDGRLTLRPTDPDDLIRTGWSISEVDGLLGGRISIRTWSTRDAIFGASDDA